MWKTIGIVAGSVVALAVTAVTSYRMGARKAAKNDL